MLLRTKRLILFCASGTLRACFFFFRHFILWLRSAVEEDIADEKILQNRDKKALISNGNHSKTATTRARTTMHSWRPMKTPARTRCGHGIGVVSERGGQSEAQRYHRRLQGAARQAEHFRRRRWARNTTPPSSRAPHHT